MAQDKIIRITADTSPLRNIRQEVQGLTYDIDNLNRTLVRPPYAPTNTFNPENEKKTETIKPITPSTPQIERTPLNKPKIEETEEVIEGKNIEREPRQSVEVIQKEVETEIERTPLPTSPSTESPSTKQPTEEKEETLEEIVPPKKKRGRPRKKREIEEEQEGQNVEQNEPETKSGSGSSQLTVLRQILKAITDGNDLAVDRTVYLEELVKKGDLDDNDIIIPPAVPIIPAEGTPGGEPEQRIEREKSDSGSRYNGGGFTGIPGALVRGALQAAGSSMNARNTYEAGAAEIGAIGQTAGSLVSAGGRIAGGVAGMIPGVGPGIQAVIGGAGELAGTAISGVTSIVSAYAMRAVAKAEELESNVRSYSQTLGVSSSEAKSTALREGAFAARDLGMNAGEYLNRFAELRRSAGGKILGATEEDPEGKREIQSQLAAQRLFGLDRNTLDELQGSLRFAREGEFQSGGSSSASGVIRIFENTMRELKLPFSEIASTIGESLDTFNKTAERVLDKAGEFDAGKIATVLANVRSYTGMEGRQLARVQEAVTGGGISQDSVTQALLMRVAREAFPEADTLSAIMEKIDKIGTEPELQQKFLIAIEGMTDTEEQFIQLLKAVFPKLNWEDVRKFAESSRGSTDFEELFNTKVSPEVAKGNEKDAQYERNVARRTVGVIESATAEKSNRDAANGESMLGVLSSIDNKVVKIATDADLVQKTVKEVNDALDTLVKLIALSREEDLGPAWRNPKNARTPGSALVDGDWRALPEGSLLMSLLKKIGLD